MATRNYTDGAHASLHSAVRGLRKLFGVQSVKCNRCERYRSSRRVNENPRVKQTLANAKFAVEVANRQPLPSTRVVGRSRQFFDYAQFSSNRYSNELQKLHNFPLAEGTEIEDAENVARAGREVLRQAIEDLPDAS